MKVLLIPEDFRNDQHILKPIFERLFREIGRSSLRVEVCLDPLLGGVTEALKSERLQEIVDQYPKIDIFILCVDRDGIVGRRQRLDQIEDEFGDAFFAENAWEEIETWVLAGLELPTGWSWREVRAEVSVKERYFEPFAAERKLSDAPGGGRRELGEEAARHIDAIRLKCPEDFDCLARRLEAAI
ncbi:MAG: hypothetical protein OXE05_08760 [Chloroflexi bacterium]|nr:hypothetical protein [Chloroflexota bacterium]